MANLAERNYNYLQKAISLKKSIERGFLTLGEVLFKIRDEEKFTPTWDTFEEFLIGDMDMTLSVANRMINVYRKFVVEFGIPEERIVAMGGWSVVSELHRLAIDKKTALKLFDKLEPLPNRDEKRKALVELRTGVPQMDCRHDFYLLRICRKCSEKQRVYEK